MRLDDRINLLLLLFADKNAFDVLQDQMNSVLAVSPESEAFVINGTDFMVRKFVLWFSAPLNLLFNECY